MLGSHWLGRGSLCPESKPCLSHFSEEEGTWESWVISFFFFKSGGSDGKAAACNVGDLGSIPGSGRSSGGGNGNPLQY